MSGTLNRASPRTVNMFRRSKSPVPGKTAPAFFPLCQFFFFFLLRVLTSVSLLSSTLCAVSHLMDSPWSRSPLHTSSCDRWVFSGSLLHQRCSRWIQNAEALCVCSARLCMCVCVWERGRERERDRQQCLARRYEFKLRWFQQGFAERCRQELTDLWKTFREQKEDERKWEIVDSVSLSFTWLMHQWNAIKYWGCAPPHVLSWPCHIL